MNNERLGKANILAKQIGEIIEKIKKVDEVVTKSFEKPTSCRLAIYQTDCFVDQDVFEIALIIQEKRLNKQLIALEEEFNKL